MTDQKKRDKEIADAAAQILEQQNKGGNPGQDPVGRAIGVDIGTSKIVVAEKGEGKVNFTSQLNAFINVEYSKFTEGILKQNRIKHHRMENSLVVYGDGAEIFANMLNMETRRPMHNGLLNPKEPIAVEIIKGILDDLLPVVKNTGVELAFSIPGAPQDSPSDIIYHEAVLKRHLSEKGYNVRSINEGMAVIFSELESENFTGLGISLGGGMCNVCLAFLSVPIVTFSLKKAGDHIDDAVASVTGEVGTRVRLIKEKDLDLTRKPKNEIEDALHIYYDDMILTLLRTVKESIVHTAKIPKFDKPISIVLSGGSAKPNGFKDRFEMFLKKEGFPLEISRVRLAGDPLAATANGALIAALCES